MSGRSVAENSATDTQPSRAAAEARVGGLTLSPRVMNVMALLLVLSGIALANTTLALQHAWLATPSTAGTVVSMLMGTFGVVLVWVGFRASDTTGSLLGYIGGALIWMGFFEWTWINFAIWLGVDPLVIDGRAVLPPTMLLVQATSFIFLPLMMLIAANKDTRCRMIRWIRRRFRLPTGSMTAGHRHQAARVAAAETIFVIWFIYLLNIALYDPRLLDRGEAIASTGVTLILLWAIYLVSRLLQLRDTGTAIRYAIPTAYLLSIPIDALAMHGWYPAVWVQPLTYPICALIAVAVFIIAALTLTRGTAQ